MMIYGVQNSKRKLIANMKLSLQNTRKLASRFVEHLGFSDADTKMIVENVVEAEISGHVSHGLGNLLWFQTTIANGGVNKTPINRTGKPFKIIKETPVSLMVDGINHTGYVVIRKALDRAFMKVKKSYIVAIAITNTAPSSGYIGHYARLAVEQNLIFMSWNTSPGRVAPHGSTSKLWGTNPITIGIPTNGLPAILDMATSKITFADLINYQRDNLPLPPDCAIDSHGHTTTNPNIARNEGALLPIGGHKGSGLSFMNEMLAGALTASKVGFAVAGGWGTFFILLDPTIFRPLKEFKRDVQAGIDELKSSNKRVGVTEIFYPGEQSQKRRIQNLENGFIEIQDEVYKKLLV